jgi:nucleoside-diphosphate-sugar epimerase
MSKKNILVTGNMGYIGTVLVPMLLERGHVVVGLDSCLFERCSIEEFESKTPVQSIDIRDITIEDLEGFDSVIHLAGLSNDPLGSYNKDITYEINHAATVSLAQKAKAAGVTRFLFASSCSNYGESGSDWITEESKVQPIRPYARSKVLSERSLIELSAENFSPVFLRASTAYGGSPMLRFDLVINNLTAWAVSTKRVYLKSTGNAWRPIVHVKDIARAYIAALEAPRSTVHNEAFNIGTTTENYRVSELAEFVREAVGDCLIEYAPDAKPDPCSYRVDCSKIARASLGFKPEWTVRRGIRELCGILRHLDINPSDFEGPRFQRLKHLKHLLSRGIIAKDYRIAILHNHGTG